MIEAPNLRKLEMLGFANMILRDKRSFDYFKMQTIDKELKSNIKVLDIRYNSKIIYFGTDNRITFRYSQFL